MTNLLVSTPVEIDYFLYFFTCVGIRNEYLDLQEDPLELLYIVIKNVRKSLMSIIICF